MPIKIVVSMVQVHDKKKELRKSVNELYIPSVTKGGSTAARTLALSATHGAATSTLNETRT